VVLWRALIQGARSSPLLPRIRPGHCSTICIDQGQVAGGGFKKECDMGCWQSTDTKYCATLLRTSWVYAPRAKWQKSIRLIRSPCSGVNSGTTCASLLRLHGIMKDESTYERDRKRVLPSCPCVIQHARVWHAGRGHCLVLQATRCRRPQHVTGINMNTSANQTQVHVRPPRTGRDQSKHGQRVTRMVRWCRAPKPP
jgi:hypothetical protein